MDIPNHWDDWEPGSDTDPIVAFGPTPSPSPQSPSPVPEEQDP